MGLFGDAHTRYWISAANRLIGEVVQSRRRPLLHALNVKFGPQHKSQKGRAGWLA